MIFALEKSFEQIARHGEEGKKLLHDFYLLCAGPYKMEIDAEDMEKLRAFALVKDDGTVSDDVRDTVRQEFRVDEHGVVTLHSANLNMVV